jgi:hypothetical protein
VIFSAEHRDYERLKADVNERIAFTQLAGLLEEADASNPYGMPLV